MDLKNIRFGSGCHKPPPDGSPPQGNRDMCIMEAVAYMAGEPWSDRPACASPVISAFLRVWNDQLPEEDRDRLLPAEKWVPRLVGSRGDAATEERRAYLALDWLIRVHTPAWFDLVPSHAAHAMALRALPEIVSLTTVQNAGVAAKAAANSATWEESWAPVGEAAGEAAKKAAWIIFRVGGWVAFQGADALALETSKVAAWAAAGSARAAGGAVARRATLQPTVEKLQDSALDLLDRMLTCEKTSS